MNTCTEVTGLSEAVDIQAERTCHDAACINITVDDREREGAVRIERLSRTVHDSCNTPVVFTLKISSGFSPQNI